MKQTELNKILQEHAKWRAQNGGERADLQGAYLRNVDLRRADLRNVDLRLANLQGADLRGANLRDADLRGANLKDADLRRADLRNVDLRLANLQGADLRGADLQDADLNFSCWPLWCGSKDVRVDRKIYLQLLAHLCAVDVDDAGCKVHQQASLNLAKQSHVAKYLIDESENENE